MKLNSLFSNSQIFHSYSLEHWIILVFGVIISAVLFIKTRKWTYLKQRKILLYFSAFLILLQLAKVPIKMIGGTFDASADLPFHLCNYLPIFLFVIFYYLSRKSWAIVFFWVILGCSQANFTPTIETSLFHWDSIRYWMVHMFLVTLVLYPILIWKWKLKHLDIWRSILVLNLLALIIYCVNYLVDGNYMYLSGKPPGETLFSLFPEWPYYILVIEVILIIWSYLLYGLYRLILGLKPKKKK